MHGMFDIFMMNSSPEKPLGQCYSKIFKIEENQIKNLFFDGKDIILMKPEK